ncbi:glycerophosphodiester phosphodiesterase family protein [Butyrivibrio sp. FCS014]|uniref:glycerophosphodiester phosphodiesterase family protein n=1 Tax=Butyrivibrio sp. FCS014 TaxID=1408304 RepID=UPI0004679CD2|nr:glycerophosphodiester phosphodiesterase family protein [Butyrivibrio sp. FCS014]
MLFFKVLCIFAAVVAILYLIMIMPRMMHRPDREKFTKVLYAHRGLHDNNTDAPENSMAAFKKAVEGGYGIECDVQLTRDGIPVIFHDFTLKRVARYENDRAAEVKGKVIDYTYDELQELVLLGSNERIPKFEDFLKMVDGRVPLIIELKIELKDLRVCGEVWKFLKDYKGVYCIESFNPLGVWWFKRNHPDIMRGQLSDEFHKDSPEEFKGILYFVLTGLLFNFLTKPDFIAFNRKYPKSVSMQLCRRLYKCTCAAWTVKSQEQLKEAAKDFDIFIFDSFIPESGSRSIF